MKNKRLSFIRKLWTVTILLSAILQANDDCFTGQRFPKVIQSSSEPHISQADSIIAHDGLNSLFIGGHISAGNLLNPAWTSGAAQVGRLELINNTWVWSKVMVRDSDQISLLTISALAIDKQGTRVACYGTKPGAVMFSQMRDEAESAVDSFIFLLDANTGEKASKLIVTKAHAASGVFSSGMLQLSDGTVLLALNVAYEDVAQQEQKLRFAQFNLEDGTSKVLGGYGESLIGLSGSLTQGKTETEVYLGGSYKIPGLENEWKLALVKIPMTQQQPDKLLVTTLGYAESTEPLFTCQFRGFQTQVPNEENELVTPSQAPYISLMAFMEGNEGADQLFGAARGEGCSKNEQDTCGLVWRVSLDSNGDPTEDYHSKRFMTNRNLNNEYIVALRNHMEYDETAQTYWVDLLMEARTENKLAYLRVSPDSTKVGLVLEMKQINSMQALGRENVFSNQKIQVRHGEEDERKTSDVYQAFEAGQIQSFQIENEFDQDEQFSKSYSVRAALNDERSCVQNDVQPDNNNDYLLMEDTLTCTASFEIQAVEDFFMDSRLDDSLEVQNINYEHLDPQTICNAGSKIKDAKTYDYTIGDEKIQIPLADLWESGTDCCVLTPQPPILNSNQERTNDLVEVFNEFQTFGIYSDDAFTSKNSKETHQITLLADYDECPQSRAQMSLFVNILNPCTQAQLQIDNGDDPMFDDQYALTQDVFAGEETLRWKINKSFYNSVDCGPIKQAIRTGSNAKDEDMSLFQFDSSSSSLKVTADDLKYEGEYVLVLKVFLEEFPDITDERMFTIRIESPCFFESFEPSSEDFIYQLNSDALEFNLHKYISNEIPVECGDVMFSVTHISEKAPFSVVTQDSDNFSLIDQETLKIETSNMTLEGLNTFYINAALAGVNTKEPLELRIHIERCPIKVQQPWLRVDSDLLIVTEDTSVTINEPIITSVTCNNEWYRFDVHFSFEGDVKNHTMSDIISFDKAARRITAKKTLDSDFFVRALISAHLTDQITVETSELVFHFYLPVPPAEEEELVQEEPTVAPDIILPLPIVDQEPEPETNVDPEEPSESTEDEKPPPEPPADWVPPESPVDEEPPVQVLESDAPTFSLKKMSIHGELEVTFSQSLSIPFDITDINSEVLQIELLLVESSMDDPSVQTDVTWSCKSFEKRRMVIQVDFEEPEFISQGIERDQLRVQVLNSKYFFSEETLKPIALNSSGQIAIPKMMPDTQFTQVFTQFTDQVQGTTQISLLLSVVVGLIMQGPLDGIWSLINSLQIVTHYALSSVMMPSNAFNTLLTIVHVQDFQFIPVESFIGSLEAGVGLESEEYFLSDNFTDFEYYSTSVMKNLQLIFVFMLILMLIPVIFFILYYVSRKNESCKARLIRATYGIFFNTYIRFLLEGFIEISLACFIRLQMLNFGSGSEAFNSLFAVVLFLVLIVSILGSIGLLHCKGPLKNGPSSHRYSELTSGLRRHYRMILLSPTFFMARRLTYAYILVNWVNDSIALVLAPLILLSGLQVAYLAHCRPSWTRLANCVDLGNEVAVLLCTYCMMTFTDLAPTAETRSTCGWAMIACVIGLLIPLNMILIIYQSFQTSKRKLRLSVTKARNKKLMKQKVAMKKVYQQFNAEQRKLKDNARKLEIDLKEEKEAQKDLQKLTKREDEDDEFNGKLEMKQDEPSSPNIEIKRADDPVVLMSNLQCYRELSSIAAMSGFSSSKSALQAKDQQSSSAAKNYILSNQANQAVKMPQNIPIKLPKSQLPNINPRNIDITKGSNVTTKLNSLRNSVSPDCSEVIESQQSSAQKQLDMLSTSKINSKISQNFILKGMLNWRKREKTQSFQPDSFSCEDVIELNEQNTPVPLSIESNQPMLNVPIDLEKYNSFSSYEKRDSII